MLERLIRNWWVLALRGVLAIVFGVIAALWPRITILSMVWLWGAYALVDGAFALAAAVRAAGREQPWMMLVLRGAVGLAAGIAAFVWSGITALAMIYLIAGWAIVSGIFEIAAAVRLRQVIEGEWLLGLSGVLTILLGVLLVIRPGAGLLAWAWMIGAYAVFFGIVMLILAFRLRGLGRAVPRQRAAA